jgi:hypothetical protein
MGHGMVPPRPSSLIGKSKYLYLFMRNMFPQLIIFQIVRKMLQNLVNGIDELRQVENTSDHMGAKSGTTLSYDKYVSLLLSAAPAYDDQYKPKRDPSIMYSSMTYIIIMPIMMMKFILTMILTLT